MIPGTVLAVSPDGSTVVVTDPTRQTVSLVRQRHRHHQLRQRRRHQRRLVSGQPDRLHHHQHPTCCSRTLPSPTGRSRPPASSTPTSRSQFRTSAPTSPAPAPTAAATARRRPSTPRAPTATRPPRPTSTTRSPAQSPHRRTGSPRPPTESTSSVPPCERRRHLQRHQRHASGHDALPACPQPAPPRLLPEHQLSGPLCRSITATRIDGVVPASNSALAFVTYTGSSGLLPEYIPATAPSPTSNSATGPPGNRSARRRLLHRQPQLLRRRLGRPGAPHLHQRHHRHRDRRPPACPARSPAGSGNAPSTSSPSTRRSCSPNSTQRARSPSRPLDPLTRDCKLKMLDKTPPRHSAGRRLLNPEAH